MASSDRHCVALALSSSLCVAMTPCYCGTLGGLSVLVGSLPFPSMGRKFGPSYLGRLLCCGWVDVPSPPRTSRTLLTCLTGCQCGSSCSIQRWTQYGCGPVFLAFGLLRPLACAPAWWSIGPGWCLNLIPTPVNCSDLPDLTLDLLVLRYSSWGLTCLSSP